MCKCSNLTIKRDLSVVSDLSCGLPTLRAGPQFRISKTPNYFAPQEYPPPSATMSQFAESVIPDERRMAGRDPWFDRPFDSLTVLSNVDGLTTLSEVEGESSEKLI
jgi:hypothetical protein